MEPKVVYFDRASGLKHDPKLWISVGRSRFETAWKNQEIRWSALLDRLKTPTVTSETHTEYMAMSKADQDRIKDTGGFVGGVLKDGKRRTETVTLRSMISFDLDHAPDGFVDRMLLEEPVAWAIYSTHKHSPEHPRLRMLIPLARTVSPEEYEAVSRKMAEEIGLEFFDRTTFQPSRLMYWPSCSRGSDYVFEYHDDDLLNPDEYLDTYADWRDTSQWPTCPDETQVRKRRTDRQQDPTKKKGLVGVFCRTYTVPEAIGAFLGDVYHPTEKPDRYTYTAGSTFGGLVVYDDGLFCYSNHSTDPAHGLDLNAFDLVRVHLYGSEDDGPKEGTPTTKLPSYKRMLDLVNQDAACRRTADAERQAELSRVFEGENEEEDSSWREKLHMSKGVVQADVFNLRLILLRDPKLSGIRYNTFTQMIENAAPAPWEDGDGIWKNSDDAGLNMYLSLHYQDFKRQDIQDVLTQVALGRRFHPVREYFDQLPPWDGRARAESLFIDYLDADDNTYVRGVTRKWLLGAVARIYRPGVKFDWCITLTGDQGIGKSTIAARLGGAWFSDSLSFDDMRDEKTAGEKLRGEWIIEIGELKGLRRIDVESVKSFLSRSVDKYRPAYAKRVEQFKRSCVFIGTGNNVDFLKDPTGSRRFWPVQCRRRRNDPKRGAWDIDRDEVAQIWAEVKTWYDSGESLELTKEIKALAEKAQEEATEQDDRAGIVGLYLDTLLPENWDRMDLDARRLWLADTAEQDGTVRRTEVSVMEIWAECFRKAPADKRRSDSDDITRLLRQLGWTFEGLRRRQPIYGQQCIFRRQKP
jgi:putative DNA primase/helicase